MSLHWVAPGIEIYITLFVMGSPDVIRKFSGFARASLEVPSVLFEPGTDLYGCMSDTTL